ncbi:unnamed protein product [Rhodiola kirilowii]
MAPTERSIIVIKVQAKVDKATNCRLPINKYVHLSSHQVLPTRRQSVFKISLPIPHQTHFVALHRIRIQNRRSMQTQY